MYQGTIFITSKEVAIRWKLTPETMKKWRCAGKSPPYRKLGKRILYKIEEIERFEDKALRYNTSMLEAPL